MGLFTFNFNTYHSGSSHGQQEPGRPPAEKNGNHTFFFEVLVGAGVTYWVDPYMNGSKEEVTQILETLTVSPEHATTYAALLCFAVVCAAPTIIRKVLRWFVN